jgi:hypothetical protein
MLIEECLRSRLYSSIQAATFARASALVAERSRRSYTTRKAYRRGALLGGTFVEIVALVVFAVLLCVTSSAVSIVPIVLAGGSFVVLFGRAAQAIDELGRYEHALHNVAGAAGFFRGIRKDVLMSGQVLCPVNRRPDDHAAARLRPVVLG